MSDKKTNKKHSEKKTLKDKSKALTEYKTGKSRLNEIFKTARHKASTVDSADKDREQQKAIKNTSRDKKINKRQERKNVEEYTLLSSSDKSRRRTEDDLPIYTKEELNIGKGGNTDQCPFDCNCCF